MPAPALEIEVTPPWPYRLPRRGGRDGVLRVTGGLITRLVHVGERPVVVHAWSPSKQRVRLRAIAAGGAGRPADLELAVERVRFAFGVDDDLSDFYRRFRSDPVLGPAIRRRPHLRVRRRPWPWEALAWAITEQLIEAARAGAIQRRMVRRWGPRLDWRRPPGTRRGDLRDVPSAAQVAALAPAELAAVDLAPARALAMIRCAREVAAGRAELADPACDRRLLAVREIGPWTQQCLALHGRGEHDSLPAGDLAYLKLVGRLAGLRRRATIAEVHEYFAPYEPYRGLAGYFAAVHYHSGVEAGPPLRLVA